MGPTSNDNRATNEAGSVDDVTTSPLIARERERERQTSNERGIARARAEADKARRAGETRETRGTRRIRASANGFSRRPARMNVLALTLARASGTWKPGTRTHKAREAYASGVTPNATTRVLDFPDVAPRRFTQSGTMLIAVSRHQQELVGYWFRGFHACLKRDKRGEVVADASAREALGSFRRHFDDAWTTTLSDGNDAIVKDFMLEVCDGAYIVAACATPLDGASVASGGAMREDERDHGRAPAGAGGQRREEAWPASTATGGMQGAPSMARVTFHLVCAKTGAKLDAFTFRDDFMHLPRNGAVSLRDDILAVLSLKYQRIVFLRILPEGRFEELSRIGEYVCAEDERMIFEHDERERAFAESEPDIEARVRERSATFAGARRPMLSGLTQRLVTFLYQEAKKSSSTDALRLLHRNFERYVSLVMLRMRILDATLLLIKFGTPEYALARRGDRVIGPTMYAVYDMNESKFIHTATSMSDSTWHGVDEELNAPPRGNSDWARFAGSQGEALAYCNTCTADVDGDDDEAFNVIATRLFRTQDYPPQFRSTSPYFDKRLFSYDERMITAIDRPQPHVDFGIKFVRCASGARRQVSFKLMVNNSLANSARSKRFVQYVFHPVLPFALSLSSAYMQPTLVNFHIRSAPGDEMHDVAPCL